jgi:hypothetical protein
LIQSDFDLLKERGFTSSRFEEITELIRWIERTPKSRICILKSYFHLNIQQNVYAMRKTTELQFLSTIKTGKGLIKLINSLKTIRRRDKVKDRKRFSLTKKQRELILLRQMDVVTYAEYK